MSTSQEKLQIVKNTKSGAVCYADCPTRETWRARQVCRCGKCVICGFPKHTAIHGPVNGGEAGSEPYDHEFMASIHVTHGDVRKCINGDHSECSDES